MSSTTGKSDYFDKLIGKEINNTYRIEEKIGAGGMGAVFRAAHLKLGGRVAVKVISPELATNKVFVKRFQREAKVGWALSHPNIIKVFEFGETEDGLLFMVMEYVEGETLSNYLHCVKRVSPKEALSVIKPLCEALDLAHNRNILHRDLKPANILLDNDGSKRTVKLADFGIVKLMQPDSQITDGSALTAMGEIFGTPQYMSPEQLMGHSIGPTADVYSLGVITYEMLTGTLPINSKDMRELFVLKMNKELTKPSQLYPFLPPAYDALLLKVMSSDPEERYQSVFEFLGDFEKLVAKFPESGQISTDKRSPENEDSPTLIKDPLASLSTAVGNTPTKDFRKSVTNELKSPLTIDAKITPHTNTGGHLSGDTIANQSTAKSKTSPLSSSQLTQPSIKPDNQRFTSPLTNTSLEKPEEQAIAPSNNKGVMIAAGVVGLIILILAIFFLRG